MRVSGRSTDQAVRAAMLTGLAMVGAHIAAKATNDALFLSNFPISALPVMLVVSSLVSLGVVLGASKAMVSLGPGRVVPGVFFGSAGVLLAVWGLLGSAPRAAAVLLFLEISTLGAVLFSGFWSMVNERFDPHTAKKKIGGIALSSSGGGVVGGLVASGVAAGWSLNVMLPILAAGHLFCGWQILGLRRSGAASGPGGPADTPPAGSAPSGWRLLAGNAYLRHLGLFVLCAGVTVVLLEFLFKSFAAGRFQDRETLLRFFSGYYLAVGVTTLAAQSLFSRAALDKLGLAKTSALLPCATAAGGCGVLFFPGLLAAGIATFSESILSNSLIRSAYELFYVPVPAPEKRATKTIIDVGLRRLSDTLGGGVTRVVLLAGAPLATGILSAMVIGLSVATLALAAALRKGYVEALERSLRERAGELDLDGLNDALSRSVVLQMSSEWPAGEGRRRMEATGTAVSAESPLARQVRLLHSGDIQQVRGLLSGEFPAELIPHVIRLLARDDTARFAIRALNRRMPAIATELRRALDDPDEAFAVRRRIPFACRRCSDPVSLSVLFSALRDPRFETRFHASRILSRIHRRFPEAPMEAARIEATIREELKAGAELWAGRAVLDPFDDLGESLFADSRLKGQSLPALDHVFALLSLTMEAAPLAIAFRGLHVDDPMLRGTALEFLAASLPPEMAEALLPLLDAAPPEKPIDAAVARELLLCSVSSLDARLNRRG